MTPPCLHCIIHTNCECKYNVFCIVHCKARLKYAEYVHKLIQYNYEAINPAGEDIYPIAVIDFHGGAIIESYQ